jgi:hypothetical protein
MESIKQRVRLEVTVLVGKQYRGNAWIVLLVHMLIKHARPQRLQNARIVLLEPSRSSPTV